MVNTVTVIKTRNTVFPWSNEGKSYSLSDIEGGVCGQNAEEREKAIVQLESMFRKTGFPYHIVPLEQVTRLRKENTDFPVDPIPILMQNWDL